MDERDEVAGGFAGAGSSQVLDGLSGVAKRRSLRAAASGMSEEAMKADIRALPDGTSLSFYDYMYTPYRAPNGTAYTHAPVNLGQGEFDHEAFDCAEPAEGTSITAERLRAVGEQV